MAGKKTGRNMPRDSEMEQEDEVPEFFKEKGSRTLDCLLYTSDAADEL